MTAPGLSWTPYADGLLRSDEAAGESAAADCSSASAHPQSSAQGGSPTQMSLARSQRAKAEVEMTRPDPKRLINNRTVNVARSRRTSAAKSYHPARQGESPSSN